ncbi:MAG: hypothetical protein EOO01_38735 [Chitinophagaceae bacterium]|nr:MAG: hypothetical protein EOO01_38735 [Chitinophagaceae bacterium]
MTLQRVEPKTHPAETTIPLDNLVDTVKEIFVRSEHQLTVLTRSPQAFELVTAHFSNVPRMTLHFAGIDDAGGDRSEELYRKLKGPVMVPERYWEQDLQKELQTFSTTIGHLENLSKAYAQRCSETQPGTRADLTFVVSNPKSPLMAVYSGSKAMVYNFSGD